jgi:hypothetical protein
MYAILSGCACAVMEPLDRQVRAWLRTVRATPVKRCCEFERLNQCADVSKRERLRRYGNGSERTSAAGPVSAGMAATGEIMLQLKAAGPVHRCQRT